MNCFAKRWNAAGVKPAPAASDAEFIRPPVSRFDRANSPRLRSAGLPERQPTRPAGILIESLLVKPDHATHFANTWHSGSLLPEGNIQVRSGGGRRFFEGWLRGKFADNDRYDKVVAELLLANGQINQSGTRCSTLHSNSSRRTSRPARRGRSSACGSNVPSATTIRSRTGKREKFWGYAAFFAGMRNARRRSTSSCRRSKPGERGRSRSPARTMVPAGFPEGSERR